MNFNAPKTKALLERFDFPKLFLDELGWDRHNAVLEIGIGGTSFALKAVAEKRGMVSWVCEAASGQQIPDRAVRKKIEHQVARTTLEHLVIFTDSRRGEQIWCWARREAGKPASVPEHFWYAASGNRGFLQKLEAIAFSLDEEASLTLVDVTARARAAFEGLSGISCASGDDGKRGTLAWPDAKSLRYLMHCWTNCWPAPTRRPRLTLTACSMG